MSKSRLSDPFFGIFLVISEVGSPDYIAKSAIFKIVGVLGDFYTHFILFVIDISIILGV